MCAEALRRRPLAVARARSRGQALVEVLVGALALVPLLLLVAWLGKVQSIRQATIAASRSLAFECTVRADECRNTAATPTLADEVRRRSFSRIDAPVFSLDRIGDNPVPTERNPLWVDRAGRPLIEHHRDIGVRVERQPFDAGESLAQSRGAGAVTGAIGSVVTLLADKAGPGRFGLDIRDGLVDARVQVGVSPSAPRSFASQLDAIPLQIHARTAVLADAWNASGPYGENERSVYTRVERGRRVLSAWEATVDARYLPVRGFLSLMGTIGLEPAADAFRYHDADVDVVPRDRVPGSPPAEPSAGPAPLPDTP